MHYFREEIAKHVPPFFERRLGEMSELFNRKISDTLSPYDERLNALIESIRKKLPIYSLLTMPNAIGAFR